MPEKLRHVSRFYNKTFETLTEEHKAPLYSTHIDLKAVIMASFNRTL